jgi:methionyl-tRNA formyltransferase
MKILFAGNKQRGITCLQALISAGHDVVAVIGHPTSKNRDSSGNFVKTAKKYGLQVFQPVDVNQREFLKQVHCFFPELIVLAGYGQIVKQEFIDIALFGCINLHGGKLPQYRGSSPMNWALINGDVEFTLSIIKVDSGVDTGDVLLERTFPISDNDTISDLHNLANSVFPEMVTEVVNIIQTGMERGRKQVDSLASYYPLRFPEDGLILWDQMTAQEIHNRIRALTDPFQGAFTYFKGERIKLLRSSLTKNNYYGEPGRIYRKTNSGLLVCASDRCLWIENAIFEKDGICIFDKIQRYEKFVTVRDTIASFLSWDKK